MVHVLVGRLPVVAADCSGKTVKLTGLDWEDQCIFGTQSEIGLFPADEESLYAILAGESTTVNSALVVAQGRRDA